MTKLMSNRLIGDSYKKIRYSDFIYMLRMRDDKNCLSEGVREQVVEKRKVADGTVPDAVSPEILSIKDRLYEVLTPLEIKITKSKDSEKNKSSYLLFCKDNLRIYNTVDEYLKDAPVIKVLSDKLAADINSMMNHAITQVVTTDFVKEENVQPFDMTSGFEFETDNIFQAEPTDGIFH